MANSIPSHPSGALTSVLADFVHQASWELVPSNIRHEIKRSLINYFAVGLAGCTDPTLNTAVQTFSRFSATNSASLVGRGERMDILNVAALNAMAANVYDYDDTHIPTIIHPTCTVAAALLAYSETSRLSGKDFMLALLLGIEIQCRIGLGVSPFHYAKGWHITSTCGVFGSAMALGKVLSLSPTRLRWAMGTAACQAGGLVEGLGTMSKSISVGNAARNGMMAALLAADGFSGPARPLEGTHGFLRVFGDTPNFEIITQGLGRDWQISKVAYKPYPCGVVLNPVLDACLALSGRLHPEQLRRITSIELTGHPLLRERTDRPNISTGRESQVSAQHAVPMALVHRKVSLESFTDAAVKDPVIRTMGALVHFHDDETYSVDSAKVVLHFNNAPSMEEYVAMAKGSLQHPLNDDELETKLRGLCRYGRSGCDAGQIIDAIWALEEESNVARIAKLAARPHNF